MPDSLSLAEVAADLGVAPFLVVRFTHRTIKAEKLPCINVGGELRFDVEQFQAWKRANWDEEAFPMLKKLPSSADAARQRRVERLTSGERFEPWEFDKDGNL